MYSASIHLNIDFRNNIVQFRFIVNLSIIQPNIQLFKSVKKNVKIYIKKNVNLTFGIPYINNDSNWLYYNRSMDVFNSYLCIISYESENIKVNLYFQTDCHNTVNWKHLQIHILWTRLQKSIHLSILCGLLFNTEDASRLLHS